MLVRSRVGAEAVKPPGIPRRAWIRRRTKPQSSPGGTPRTRKPRKATDFQRVYGSKRRVAFVKSLPCIVPFCDGWLIENHHVISGGEGRKADACWIVPLCLSHHRELHNQGAKTFQSKYGLDLRHRAAATQAAWERYAA
jgi:hypothetical protein